MHIWKKLQSKMQKRNTLSWKNGAKIILVKEAKLKEASAESVTKCTPT